MSHVPTIADLLKSTDIGNGLHRWRVEGGAITVTQAELTLALKEAYDPFMADWPATVDIETDLS